VKAVRLSIVIPSVGRTALAATLDSIKGAGVQRTDEVLIVADGGAPGAHDIAEASGLSSVCKLRVVDLVPAGGDYGQPGRNFGMGKAKGTHVMFGQDDNVLMTGALTLIRDAVTAAPDRLHFFRVQPRCGIVVGNNHDEEGLPMLGHIDADCGVVPRDRVALGKWGDGYNGDFDFWYETAANYRGRIEWHDEIISCHQRG